MTSISSKALANTRRTVQSYEGFAREYDALCGVTPSPEVEDALMRLMQALPQQPSILEIGSGPGREADFLQALGARMRRTDATQAFIELQAQRGKSVDLLNVVTDEISGTYDGVLALCVLIHVDRDATDSVLRKIRGALRPGGALLVSMRTGDGETEGSYHTVYWSRDCFAGRLNQAGFVIEWDALSVDSDIDEWITFLARRSS